MSRPLISVLMPVKNTVQYLGDCLDSILSQTNSNWELIVVDDHSTDESLKLLTAYSKKDKRIQVFKNTGSGIIEALRLAHQHSTGKFITRMDSDDLMEPEKLELMSKQLQLKGEGYIAVGFVNYFSAGKLGDGYIKYANWLNTLTSTSSNFSDIYRECSIPSPCWMVSRNDFEQCGGFASNTYPEDYDLAFRFRKAGLKVLPIVKVIHQWRDYSSRTSRTSKNYSDNRFSELKVFHFLDQDYNRMKPLVIWGAGNKGKKIAALLTDMNIPFRWMCNNANKIGKNIYGTLLQDLGGLSQPTKIQVIVAISSQHNSDDVENLIESNQQHQYFRFS